MEKLTQSLLQEYSYKLKQKQIEVESYKDFANSFPKFKALYIEYNDLIIQSFLNNAKVDTTKINSLNTKIKSLALELEIDLKKLHISYDCEKCKDTGKIGSKFCDCFLKKLKILQSLEYSINLNKQHTFENSLHEDMQVNNISKIYSTLQKWCKNINNTLIKNINLLGDTGCGKTYLLESISNYFLENDKDFIFTTAFSLNHECRKYHCSQDSLLEQFLSTPILIIDDLGTEPMLNNITKEYLYNILNERQNKITLISTNLSFENLLERYGSRITSRLAKKDTSLCVEFKGKDFRTKI